jgi:hypothetical protein
MLFIWTSQFIPRDLLNAITPARNSVVVPVIQGKAVPAGPEDITGR